MDNEVLRAIRERRSIRRYKPEQITDEELKTVLEAGTWAPTGHGTQDPCIVAVQNVQLIERLVNMMLAAHSIGLASCWINREDAMFATKEGKELMEEMGLRDGLLGVGALALGYAASQPKTVKPRREDYYSMIK